MSPWYSIWTPYGLHWTTSQILVGCQSPLRVHMETRYSSLVCINPQKRSMLPPPSLNALQKPSSRTKTLLLLEKTVPLRQKTSLPISKNSALCFYKEFFDILPDPKPWDHAIKLVPGGAPSGCKVYPLSPSEQKELNAFLTENLEFGHIGPSKSPMASLVFFTKKKDGALCLVQDYRALNAIMVKNKYPLPLISELIEKLRGARYFTKLDV